MKTDENYVRHILSFNALLSRLFRLEHLFISLHRDLFTAARCDIGIMRPTISIHA